MATPELCIVQPERMNLLGLFVASQLRRRLDEHMPALDGEVVVIADGMRVTLRFSPEQIAITREAPRGRPKAELRGSLRALLDVGLGRGLVRHWWHGDLRVRGQPLALWHLMRLLVPKRPRMAA